MIQWGKVGLILVTTFARLVTYARERELIGEGEQRQIAAAMHLQATQILLANEARDQVRRRAAATAGELPDDGFRRD